MTFFIRIVLMITSVILGSMIACLEYDNCSPVQDIARGTFKIVSSDGDFPKSGTVEIRTEEVEIVYPDGNGVRWHVLYRIASEEE